MRKISISGNKILLNNKPIFLRTVLDQGYYPDGIYTAPKDEFLKRDIILPKKLGFNGARLHQKVFERRFLYYADKLGYLVWGEHGDWGINYKKPDTFKPFMKQWVEEIKRDFNHPSIIGWCPINEWYNVESGEFIKKIFFIIKELDPTRLVIDSSGGFHPIIPDIYDIHNYAFTPDGLDLYIKALLNKKELNNLKKIGNKSSISQYIISMLEKNSPYKNQPIYVSEYGGIGWIEKHKEKDWAYGNIPKTEREFKQRYKKLTEYLLNNPSISGFCYTQLYDIENEKNGLLYYNRKPKFDFDFFYKINTQKAAIEK